MVLKIAVELHLKLLLQQLLPLLGHVLRHECCVTPQLTYNGSGLLPLIHVGCKVYGPHHEFLGP